MHRRFARWRVVAPLLIVGLSLSACVTKPTQQAEPHWVRRGEGVFWDVAALYAVGMSGVGDIPTEARPAKVLKQEADQHARAQIATTLVTYVDQLLPNAAALETAFGAGDAALSKDVVQAIHAAVLSEGIVVQRWIDPFSQAVYSLLRIDRRRIVGAMTTGQRDEADRRRVAAQADATFERLRRQGAPWR